MKKRDSRKELKELLVMLALGIPGLGLSLGGFKVFMSSGGVNVPGAIMVGVGACLVLAMGNYHYRKDYSGFHGRRGVFAFLAVTALSSAAGIIAVRLLLHR